MTEVLSWILFIYAINLKTFKHRGVILSSFGEHTSPHCLKVPRNISYGEMDIPSEIVAKQVNQTP